jgi:transposase
VQLRYNYRLYPSPGQRQSLARAFGCARVVFNDGLRARQEAHAAGLPYISDAELSSRLTAVKATAEREWLTGVSAVVLQQALADLNAAYRNFFASVTGKRAGPPVAAPPVGADQSGVLGLRGARRAEAAECPGVDLRGLRCKA